MNKDALGLAQDGIEGDNMIVGNMITLIMSFFLYFSETLLLGDNLMERREMSLTLFEFGFFFFCSENRFSA